MPPRISLFPKCYFDELADGRRSYAGWIREAATLGGEGIEHYDGFFRSLAPADVDPIAAVMEETGQITSLICFSPDFTHPEADERRRQVERQKAAIDLTVRLGATHCRTLSGQRHPGMSRADGIARTIDGITRSLEYAGRRGVVLCMENHYKDGTWRYPEFAQPEDIFLEILERIDAPNFGVQYDPSNALVGGYDPLRFLRRSSIAWCRCTPRIAILRPARRWTISPPATAPWGTRRRLPTARPARAATITTRSSGSCGRSGSTAGSRSRTE